MTGGTRTVEAMADGRPLLVVRPDGSPGQCSVDLLCTLARARAATSGACFLPPQGVAAELTAAVVGADVPLVRPEGWRLRWLESRWRAGVTADRARARWRAASASGFQELYRELRRHAGDERLPTTLRRRLREVGHRAYERAQARRSLADGYPRRLLRAASRIIWSTDMLAQARADAAAIGVPACAPVVAFEVRTRPAVARAAIRALVAAGYVVVRVGDPGAGPFHQQGLIDLATAGMRHWRAELFVVAHARFAVVGSLALQQLTYLTNTPSLTIDAADPFSRYPVRANGVMLLSTAVDLDTGREASIDDRLSVEFFRSRRNFGHRGVSESDLLAAIGEMQDGLSAGWRDSAAQERFRERAVEAGQRLAPSIPFVAEWGPDDGFLGDGRLARVQAERAS